MVFLRDGECSDGMSDTTHPVNARASLPDGRFLAGCCRIPGAPPAAAAAAPLEGPGWRLTGMPGRDAAALAALPRPVRARFERGRVTGSSGCNNLMGSYTLDGDRLKLGPLAGSMMACPDPAMSIENAFKAAFAGTLRYAIKGDRLSLTSEAGATLSFEKEPAPKLEGVTWQTSFFNNNRQAVIEPPGGHAHRLRVRGRHGLRQLRLQRLPCALHGGARPHHDRARIHHVPDVRRGRHDTGAPVPGRPEVGGEVGDRG